MIYYNRGFADANPTSTISRICLRKSYEYQITIPLASLAG